MINKLDTSNCPLGRSKMNRLKVLAVAAGTAMAMGGAGSAAALEVLAANEAPSAVNWSTTGGYLIQDNSGGTIRETINFQTAGAHIVTPTTLTVTIINLDDATTRTVVAEASDPFWGTAFTFQPMELNEGSVPASPATVGNVNFIGNYAGTFGTQYTTDSGFIAANAYSTASPSPFVQANGTTASIDCCGDSDMQNIAYGGANPAGGWLQLADGTVVNVEQLLAAEGQNQGDLNSTLQNAGTPTCNILEDIRAECSPGTTSMSGSFSIPLDVPSPELVCTGQSFGANAASAVEGEDILATFSIEVANIGLQSCANVNVTEEISCAGGDLDLSATGAGLPAGCTMTENPADSGTYEIACTSLPTLTSASPTADMTFTTSFTGTEGSCTKRMTALSCEASSFGTLVGGVAGCQDSLARAPTPPPVPAISPLGLSVLLLGLPVVGGMVARRRNRKG